MGPLCGILCGIFQGPEPLTKWLLFDSEIKWWTPFYFGDMNMLGRSVHWCNLQGHSPERIASGQIGANVAGCVALFFSSPPLLFLLLPHSLGFCWTQKFFFEAYWWPLFAVILLIRILASVPHWSEGQCFVDGPIFHRSAGTSGQFSFKMSGVTRHPSICGPVRWIDYL